MDLLLLPDHIVVELEATDCTGQSTSFNIAYKYLPKTTCKYLYKTLLTSTEDKVNAILLANIVYVDKVALSNGSLTNSLEAAILPAMLQSQPYYEVILATFLEFLNTKENLENVRNNLQKQNLANIGDWLYKDEHTVASAIKEAEIVDEFDDILEFGEETAIACAPELRYVLTSNVKLYEIYLICRKWCDENRMLSPLTVVECCKEHNVKVTTALDLLPILHFNYLSHIPKDT